LIFLLDIPPKKHLEFIADRTCNCCSNRI